MEWIWSRWRQLEDRISGSGHTLLLLDYDGTLAPIAPVPEQATLPSAMKSALRRLARSSNVTVAVISGRRLAELRRLVGLRNVTYVGNHGLEMIVKGPRKPVEVPQSSLRLLTIVRPRLAALAADVAGARIEDKGLSIALHYRLVHGGNRVSRLQTLFRRQLAPFVRSGQLTILNGKRVLEVRPNVRWTKGHAALWLVKRMRRRSLLPIYIGDDRTDEDAFDMLKGGVTIRVGFHRRSKAAYHVCGILEVLAFLQELITLHASDPVRESSAKSCSRRR